MIVSSSVVDSNDSLLLSPCFLKSSCLGLLPPMTSVLLSTKYARLNASQRRVSSYKWNGSRLERTVPENRRGYR